jgi:hypothetical protein
MSARLMQVDIVNALRKGDRQRASIMLSNLQQTKQALTSEDFSHILEYCAEAPDPLVNSLPDTYFNESTEFGIVILITTTLFGSSPYV